MAIELVEDPDIIRAAKLVIKQHGKNAAARANQRRRELFIRGDIEASELWRQIFEAIQEQTCARREGNQIGSVNELNRRSAMDNIARGIATAALTLQSVLLQALVHKGVLTSEEALGIVDGSVAAAANPLDPEEAGEVAEVAQDCLAGVREGLAARDARH